MKIGLHALGIGTGAAPAVIAGVAREAEAAGFATLWTGEHVVMVDQPGSRYPYAEDGRIGVPVDADWLDPLATLTFAAAVTSRIRLATGVLLLAEHQPVVMAKRIASLDLLSGGRFLLGIGTGWSAEEFAALGVPFAGRAHRLWENLEAMRALWREDIASYQGELVRFGPVRSYPKPVRDRQVPVVMGGNSNRALDRAAAYCDGWYGFNLSGDEVPERLAVLAESCRRRGRDPSSLERAVALRDGTPADLSRLAALGVTELVVVASPPADPDRVGPWVRELALHWHVTARATSVER